MSNTVDSRVVEMKFDNKNFESNVSQSMSTLDKLKQKLQFKDASKSLKDLENTTSNFNMTPMEKAANVVSERFSAMGVVAMTVLQNLTTSAMNAGANIVKALTLQPVMAGFQEYETQINAVQTILANTSHNNTTLDQVNAALDELNLYADKTIYNFTEMTRNIGTFTAAGVDLDTSTQAIKGIANLAAVSGSTSQQASTAMYQLSQALAAGKVNLMDWNSVVNAGMGGKVFQDSLLETARVHGIAIDDMIKKRGSFRETLQEGWLSSELLLETLQKFTGDLSKEQLIQMGYTEEQTEAILKMGQTANDAATKVKTWTQLVDTLGEALQSGWTQSWEIILGDFEEAKELFTEVSDTLGEMINDSAEARNTMLQSWKDLGGRTAVIDGIRNTFQGIVSIVKAIGDAFSEIFPPLTGEKLADISFKFRDLTERMKPSEETLDKIKRAAKGVFSVLDILGQALGAIAQPIASFLGGSGIGGIADVLLSGAAAIGDWLTGLNESIKQSKAFASVSGMMSAALGVVSNAISFVVDKVKDLSSNFGGIGRIFESVGSVIGNAMGKVKAIFVDAINWIKDNFTLGDILTGVNIAGGVGFVKMLMNISEKVKDILGPLGEAFGEGGGGLLSLIMGKAGDKDKGPSMADTFKEVLGSVNETLQSFTAGIKVASIIGIAGAVMILSSALRTISEIDAVSLTKSMIAIGVMLKLLSSSLETMSFYAEGKASSAKLIAMSLALIGVAAAIRILASAVRAIGDMDFPSLVKGLGGLVVVFESLSRFLDSNALKNFKVSSAVGLILLATAIRIMASSVKSIGEMPLKDIVKGLVGLAGVLVGLSAAMKVMNGTKVPIKTMAALALLAISIRLIVDPMKEIGEMSWGNIARSLVGMGVALGEMVATIAVLDKFGGKGSIKNAAAVLVLSLSLGKIAEALSTISDIKASSLAKALGGMGVALGELAAMFVVLDRFGGKKQLSSAASVVVMAQALKPIADALQQLSGIAWTSLAKALGGMGIAIGELVAVFIVLDKFGGKKKNLTSAVSMVIMVQTLKPIADALQQIGSLRWQDVVKGVAGMAGALAALSGTMIAIGKFGGGATSLLASGSLLIAVQSLKPIADALQQVGSMRWQDVVKGVAGLVATLGSLAAITTISGNLGSFMSLFGSVNLLVSVQSLMPVAEALNELRGFSMEEMGAAVTGLVSVLGSLALVTGLSGTLAGVGSLLGSASLLIGVQALKPIADALRDIGALDSESLDRAIGAIIGALAAMAGGGLINSLSILGDLTLLVGVQTLKPLGEGLKEFATMGWDEIERGTEAMKRAMETAAWGGLVNTLSLFGDFALVAVAGSLVDLAKGFQEFSSMSWDEINHAAEAMKTSMEAIAEGAGALTWQGMGADVIASVAEPIGTLARSVKEWESVSVPADIGSGLQRLADGVGAFTLSGLGAGAIAESAGPLGVMAQSVKEWEGVVIPEDLGTRLGELGDGVRQFGPQFLNGLGETAGPLGTMAQSVKEWENVNVPPDLSENLKKLGAGISSFGLEFFTGDNIGKVVGPLADLAGSVGAWSGIQVPEGLKDKLQDLRDGVAAFGLEFFTGDNLAKCVGPLKELAGSVRAWEGVTFPTGYSLELELYGLKNGVASVSQLDGDELSSVVGPLRETASSVNAWSTVAIPEGIEARLKELASGVKALKDIGSVDVDFSSLTNSVRNLISSLSSTYPSQFSSAGQSLIQSFNSGISSVSVAPGLISQVISLVSLIRGQQQSFASVAKNIGTAIATNIRTGFSSQSGTVLKTVQTTIQMVLAGGLTVVRSYSGQFRSAGLSLMTSLANGIRTGSGSVKSAISNSVSGMTSSISGYYWSFYNSGVNMMAGLANGIRSGASSAINAAATVARQALNAAKAALGEKSPSREFMKVGDYADQGLALGFVNNVDVVKKASRKVGEESLEVMRGAISRVSKYANLEIDSSPKISPVLDLSNVQNGIKQLNSSFAGKTVTATVDANLIPRNVQSAASLMNAQNDAIQQSNADVLNALGDLNSVISMAAQTPGDQQEIALYIDSKKLASTTAKATNRRLSVLAKRNGI